MDKIPLFWWSETRLMGKQKENYGDLLSKYLVEKISGRTAKWVKPRKKNIFGISPKNYLCIGSILQHGNRKSIVWGSGIIDKKHQVLNCDFRAVRGPETRNFLLSKGYECPDVYGDPAILLPDYFLPAVKKKFKIGIVPHYVDHHIVENTYKNVAGVKVIDAMTMDVEETTKEILECETIISSSLHGIIMAHAYGVPALHVKFSEKIFGDGVKYLDYCSSVNLDFREPLKMESRKYELEELKDLMENKTNLPENECLEKVKSDLMKACPFTE